MTYGAKQLKNGKRIGYIVFDSGKRVYLNEDERRDFDARLRFIEETGREKERMSREE